MTPSADGLVVGLAAADRAALAALAERTAVAVDAGRVPVRVGAGRHRLAVLGADAAAIAAALRRAAAKLTPGGADAFRIRGVAYYSAGEPGRVALLFPGQGSQYPGMLTGLAADWPDTRAWFDALDAAFARGGFDRAPSRILAADEADLNGLTYGAPLGIVASLALAEVLAALGVNADAVAGHSNGEHAALTAAGAVTHADRDAACDHLLRVARLGRDLRPAAEPEGMLAVSGLTADAVAAALGRVADAPAVAIDNCPGQCVLSGTRRALEAAAAAVAAAGGLAQRLPTDRAYHTPLFADWSRLLRGHYTGMSVQPPRVPVYSCLTAAPFPTNADTVRDLIARQWSAPVRFREVVERLYADGVRTFVEVGPDEKLTAFVGATLRGRPHLAVSASSRYHADGAQLRRCLAELFARGIDVQLERLRPPAPIARPRGEWLRAAHAELVAAAHAGMDRVRERVEGRVGRSPAVAAGGLFREGVQANGVRLTARRRFTPQGDRYVADHSLGRRGDRAGLPVLPFTLSLGLAVEAARRLIGADGRVELTGARAHRWLALDRGVLDVRVEAEREAGSGAVRVAVAGHDPDGKRYAAFDATVAATPDRPTAAAITAPARGALRWGAGEFYRRFAFHGPAFQTLARVDAVGPDGAAATLRATTLPGLDVPAVGLDPAVLDAAGQLVAVWLLEQGRRDFGLYPFALDRLTLFALPAAPGSELRLIARMRRDPAGWTEADLEFTDPTGALVARLDGFRQRLVTFPPGFARLLQGGGSADDERPARLPDAELLTANGGIWARVLAHQAFAPDELDDWYRAGRPVRPLELWLEDRRRAPRLAGAYS